MLLRNKMGTKLNTTDHDLLIRLDTKVDNITTEMVMMRDNVTIRISELNSNKLDISIFKQFLERYERESRDTGNKDGDYEARLRRIEVRMYIGMGVLLALQFLSPIVIKYVLE